MRNGIGPEETCCDVTVVSGRDRCQTKMKSWWNGPRDGQIRHSKGGVAPLFSLKSRDPHDTHCYVLIQVMGDDFGPVLTVATDSLAFAD